MGANQSPVSIQRLVRRGYGASYSEEYGVQLRRLFPWEGVADTRRAITELGVIWVLIEPGKCVAAHVHDEEEAFFITSGEVELTLEGETAVLCSGDMVYIPRFARHSLLNRSTDIPCYFLDVYWDNRGREPPPRD
jgi:mannose-6-phosphate isomerase-like protein (cupin superfamily)